MTSESVYTRLRIEWDVDCGRDLLRPLSNEQKDLNVVDDFPRHEDSGTLIWSSGVYLRRRDQFLSTWHPR